MVACSFLHYITELCHCCFLLQSLRHENLVNLIEVFRRKKRLYLVFEFVDNTILDELEKYPNGLDEGYIRKILWQTFRGTDFCHSHNVTYHKDNIFINFSYLNMHITCYFYANALFGNADYFPYLLAIQRFNLSSYYIKGESG